MASLSLADFEQVTPVRVVAGALMLALVGVGCVPARGPAELADEPAIGAGLQAVLDRLGARPIPVNIVYRQGPRVLGLN
jgi:hypothetical protein